MKLQSASVIAAAVALAGCGSSGQSTSTQTRTAAAAGSARTVAVADPAAVASTTVSRTASGSASAAVTPAAGASIAPTPGRVNPLHPQQLASLPKTSGGPTLVIDQPGGVYSQQNQLIYQGVLAALTALNSQGGVAHAKVRLVTAHLDGLSASAVQQRLRASGPNPVLILPCDSNSQTALATGAAPSGTLMLAPCSANASLAERLSTYWAIGMDGSDESQGLVSYMARVGFSPVFILNVSGSDFASSMSGYFQGFMKRANLSIDGSTTISSTPSAADIARVVSAVRSAAPAAYALYTPLQPPYVDQLAAALKAAGLHLDLFGTSAMDVPLSLSSRDSSALQGTTFPTYGFLPVGAEGSEFLRDYKQQFGSAPVGAFPDLGFETVALLEDAIAKARSTRAAALQQALLGGIADGGAALFARTYDRAGDHNPVTTVSLAQISQGGFLSVLTIQPDGAPPPP